MRRRRPTGPPSLQAVRRPHAGHTGLRLHCARLRPGRPLEGAECTLCPEVPCEGPPCRTGDALPGAPTAAHTRTPAGTWGGVPLLRHAHARGSVQNAERPVNVHAGRLLNTPRCRRQPAGAQDAGGPGVGAGGAAHSRVPPFPGALGLPLNCSHSAGREGLVRLRQRSPSAAACTGLLDNTQCGLLTRAACTMSTMVSCP